MKNFITMSRGMAKRYSHKDVLEEYIIISINEPNEKPLKFNRNIRLKDVLYLYFEDISEIREGFITISDKDVSEIFNFINKHKNIDNIIIHCLAGVSRSVSIRCALEEVYNKRVIGKFVEEKNIKSNVGFSLKDILNEKDDNIYIFNKLCYEKVKSHFKNKAIG